MHVSVCPLGGRLGAKRKRRGVKPRYINRTSHLSLAASSALRVPLSGVLVPSTDPITVVSQFTARSLFTAFEPLKPGPPVHVCPRVAVLQ